MSEYWWFVIIIVENIWHSQSSACINTTHFYDFHISSYEHIFIKMYLFKFHNFSELDLSYN